MSLFRPSYFLLCLSWVKAQVTSLPLRFKLLLAAEARTVWGFLLLWFSLSHLSHCLGELRLPFLARRGRQVSWSWCELPSMGAHLFCFPQPSLVTSLPLATLIYPPLGSLWLLRECFCNVMTLFCSPARLRSTGMHTVLYLTVHWLPLGCLIYRKYTLFIFYRFHPIFMSINF